MLVRSAACWQSGMVQRQPTAVRILYGGSMNEKQRRGTAGPAG